MSTIAVNVLCASETTVRGSLDCAAHIKYSTGYITEYLICFGEKQYKSCFQSLTVLSRLSVDAHSLNHRRVMKAEHGSEILECPDSHVL